MRTHAFLLLNEVRFKKKRLPQDDKTATTRRACLGVFCGRLFLLLLALPAVARER